MRDIPEAEHANFNTFKDALSEPVLRHLAPNTKQSAKTKKKQPLRGKRTLPKSDTKRSETAQDTTEVAGTAEDLIEFIEFLAELIFPTLTADVRSMTYAKYKESEHLQDKYATPISSIVIEEMVQHIPPPAIDSLEAYDVLPAGSDAIDQTRFLAEAMEAYIYSTTAPPPIWITTRQNTCELCERDWVPLTYHHLIPKATHARVLKRGWHTEDQLNRVAWLCRACHSFVHRLASNEMLAREYYTTSLISQGGLSQDPVKRQEVENWIKWISGIRWNAR